MRRIGVYLGCAFKSGGVAQYSQALLGALAGLDAGRYSVTVIFDDSSWAGWLSSRGFAAHQVSGGNWGWLSKAWVWVGLPNAWFRKFIAPHLPLAQFMQQERCDYWVFPAHDAWSYQMPVKSVATIHDLMHRYESSFPEVASRGRFLYRENHFKNVCEWADAILVDSVTGKTHVQESYGAEVSKIFALPYIPPEHVYVRQTNTNLESAYDLPEKYFFYPAQFWPHKNHLRLVSALAEARKRFPEMKLVLVGGARNGFKSIIEQVTNLDLGEHVIFFDYIPDEDMAVFYRHARALIMPTFFGPTNIPQLEAFVLGCPVATSDIYGIPEQVGDAALLFDPNSIQEMSDIMCRLWSDDELCRELIKRGYDKAATWGPKEFSARLESILDKLSQ